MHITKNYRKFFNKLPLGYGPGLSWDFADLRGNNWWTQTNEDRPALLYCQGPHTRTAVATRALTLALAMCADSRHTPGELGRLSGTRLFPELRHLCYQDRLFGLWSLQFRDDVKELIDGWLMAAVCWLHGLSNVSLRIFWSCQSLVEDYREQKKVSYQEIFLFRKSHKQMEQVVSRRCWSNECQQFQLEIGIKTFSRGGLFHRLIVRLVFLVTCTF